MEVNQDVSFTADNQHLEVPTLTTQAETTSPGSNRGTNPIIEPGREIVIEVEDTSTNGGEVSLTLIYYEIDRVPSEEMSLTETLNIA